MLEGLARSSRWMSSSTAIDVATGATRSQMHHRGASAQPGQRGAPAWTTLRGMESRKGRGRIMPSRDGAVVAVRWARGGRNVDAIIPGRYRHYKGNDYTVLGVARHSETLEALVVYRQEYGERGLWVRPAAMFAGTVVVDGRAVPRFARLDPP